MNARTLIYYTKRTLLFVAGWLLLIVGIFGLFLPVIQGVVLIVIGLYLLSFFSSRLGKMRTTLSSVRGVGGLCRKVDRVIKRTLSKN